MEGEPADTAVEIPQAAGLHRVHPLGDLVVEADGHGGVRLEEALRAQVQIDPVEVHPQRSAVQHLLTASLEHGLVLGQEIDRDHARLRHEFEEPRPPRPQHIETVLGAHDESDHQVSGRRRGDMDELELTSAGGDRVGLETGGVEEVGENRNDRPDRGRLDPAFAQVDAVELLIEDAQGHVPGSSSDGELRPVAEVADPAGEARQPHRWGRGRQNLVAPDLLVGDLLRVLGFDESARPAFSALEVPAFESTVTRRGGDEREGRHPHILNGDSAHRRP